MTTNQLCRRPARTAVLGLVLAGVVFAAALVVAGSASRAAESRHSTQAETLRMIERERLKALVNADTASAGRLMASDFQLINPGGSPLSRSEYLGAVAAGEIDYLRFEPASPITVRAYGDVAAVRYQVNFDLVVAGTRLTHAGWITELWERHSGRWQIVWEQATAVPNDFGLFVQSLLPPS